jgi:hypothetical protein
MLQINSLVGLASRLKAALSLVLLAETVIPRLVSDGHTTAENAAIVLAQIPELRTEIQAQIDKVKEAMEAIQDRVEGLAQFLLLHRAALTSEQSAELDRNLAALRE